MFYGIIHKLWISWSPVQIQQCHLEWSVANKKSYGLMQIHSKNNCPFDFYNCFLLLTYIFFKLFVTQMFMTMWISCYPAWIQYCHLEWLLPTQATSWFKCSEWAIAISIVYNIFCCLFLFFSSYLSLVDRSVLYSKWMSTRQRFVIYVCVFW